MAVIPVIIEIVLLLLQFHSTLAECPSGYKSFECCMLQPTANTPTPTNTLSNDIIVNVHNSYRAAHHVQPLTYSGELQRAAQELANECLGEIKSTGQNMMIMYGGTTETDQDILASAVTTWYNTIPNYNFNNPKFYEKAGLATQVLWKSTRQVGCAIGMCRESKRVIVCKYNPPGNIFGQFGENVLPK